MRRGMKKQWRKDRGREAGYMNGLRGGGGKERVEV